MCPIREMHAQSFELLSRFYAKHRFYAVYGNHDITKRSAHFSGRCFSSCFCWQEQCEIPLFPEITFYPGIILKDCAKRKDLFLLHGHQSDLLNSTLWRLSRFLVRYVWRPLESLGIPDPTSAAKKPHKEKCYGKEAVRMGKTARTDSDCRSHPPPRYRKPYLSVLQHRKLCIPRRHYCD